MATTYKEEKVIFTTQANEGGEFHEIMDNFKKLFLSDSRFPISIVPQEFYATTPHGREFVATVTTHKRNAESTTIDKMVFRCQLKCEKTNQYMTLVLPFNKNGYMMDYSPAFEEMDRSTYTLAGNTKLDKGGDESKGAMFYWMMTTIATTLPSMMISNPQPFLQSILNKYFK